MHQKKQISKKKMIKKLKSQPNKMQILI